MLGFYRIFDIFIRKIKHNGNEWMVDNSDAVIAVWDGTPGATANTVDYARKLGRSVLVIDPVVQTEKWIMD